VIRIAVGDVNVGENEVNKINDLRQHFSNRPLWMAASIHRGEEQVILRVHEELIKMYPTLLLILVPRHPQDCKKFSLALKKQEVNFVLRSTKEVVSSGTRVYMVDTLGELRMLYRVTSVAVIGGSFLPGLAGHNISEAAAAGCAVVTGPHVGHFYHMLLDMWQINPLAVKQVAGEFELLQTLKELLGDAETLGACQRAAKDAFSIMSHGVVNRVWNLVCRFAIDF
jgi:3-deoxy-D-manno-octulosonic-acid transferase